MIFAFFSGGGCGSDVACVGDEGEGGEECEGDRRGVEGPGRGITLGEGEVDFTPGGEVWWSVVLGGGVEGGGRRGGVCGEGGGDLQEENDDPFGKDTHTN